MMGYYINMLDSNFVIKKENFEKALESLKSVFVPENMTCYDYINGKEYPHFSWVSTKLVLESKTLEEALEEIRYESKYDSDGNICRIEFTGEKYGDEDIFFAALAPYVEPGSFVSFEGEDGERWQWKFTDGKVEEVSLN